MSKWPIKKLDKHIIESKEQYGSEKLNGIQVLSVTNDQGFVFSDKRTSENVSNYKIIKNGYFAYNPYRINVGSLAFAGDEYSGIVSPAYVVFSCAKDLNPEYLWKYLKSDVGLFHIRQGGKGSVRSSLSFERLQEIEIPLPPLPEQKRIVKKIKEIEEKRKEIIELENYIGKAVDNIVPSALEKIFGDSIWEKNQIGNLIEEIKTGTTPPSGEIKYYKEERNWFTPSDFKGQMYLENSYRKISQLAIDDGKVKIYQPGTILFIGIGATLGKVGVLKKEASSNQQITGIRFKKDILPEFAYYWFKANYSEIRGLCPATTLPILNQEKIKKLTFAYPKSIAEQQEIVDHLNLIENKKEELKQEKRKKHLMFSAFMPSVLAKAFNGEL
ncbi:MAG TPA: restriction endonuclease subunit S [Candidatus Magasanikbacteria bacterium]|nr:restriction endonuclease subunit S [Candidatus Magasanikbacteria bacterium]